VVSTVAILFVTLRTPIPKSLWHIADVTPFNLINAVILLIYVI